MVRDPGFTIPYPLLMLDRYGLSLATSVMLWMIVRKKPNEVTRRVRQNRNW